MINFDYDGKTFQITFSYPDKWAEKLRKYTCARLSCKITNPENPQDFAWETWDETLATCNIVYDYFDKLIGKKVAFKKLIDRNFDRKTRTILWQKFFEEFYGG